MKFNDTADILSGIPHMQPKAGKMLYNFILHNDIKNVLECGFAHGTSACYMAAALEEKGSGLITTIDIQGAKKRKPNIFELLSLTRLNDYVKPVFADTSYNSELMKIIESQTKNKRCEPIFDFCFIDGAHSWETDGRAFFLVEKLLRPGAWILFDDLNRTYAQSPALKNTERVKRMPDDQKHTPQVEKVFSLLVRQSTKFENIKIVDDWGWAQKKGYAESGSRETSPS